MPKRIRNLRTGRDGWKFRYTISPGRRSTKTFYGALDHAKRMFWKFMEARAEENGADKPATSAFASQRAHPEPTDVHGTPAASSGAPEAGSSGTRGLPPTVACIADGSQRGSREPEANQDGAHKGIHSDFWRVANVWKDLPEHTRKAILTVAEIA